MPGPTRRRKIECGRQCRQALGHNPRTRRRAHGRKGRHLLAPPPSQRAMVRGRLGRGNGSSLRQRPLPLVLSSLTRPSVPITRDSNDLPRVSLRLHKPQSPPLLRTSSTALNASQKSEQATAQRKESWAFAGNRATFTCAQSAHRRALCQIPPTRCLQNAAPQARSAITNSDQHSQPISRCQRARPSRPTPAEHHRAKPKSRMSANSGVRRRVHARPSTHNAPIAVRAQNSKSRRKGPHPTAQIPSLHSGNSYYVAGT